MERLPRRLILGFAVFTLILAAGPHAVPIGEQQKLLAPAGAAFDEFGSRVAIDGDTAIVGANLDDVGSPDQGSAFVFTRSGGVWTLQATLTASDGDFGDRFGAAVAVRGDTAVVGAVYDTIGSNFRQGSAYVFTRSGTTWTQQAKLTVSDGAAGDEFGHAVALSGETVLIGARVAGAVNQGAAYVFTRTGGVWSQQAVLLASDGAGGDGFGAFAALDGDTALVGAHDDAVGGNGTQGSAYVFRRTGTSWNEEAHLTASDGAAGDQFGTGLAVSGDTLLVGAPGRNVGSSGDQGAVYVFTRASAVWTQQAQLTASDGAAGDVFGVGVSLEGDRAIVGAWGHNVGTNANQGAAYSFSRAGTVWSQEAVLTASDGSAGDELGLNVALSGDTAIVGSYRDDIGAEANQGSAYVFVGFGPLPGTLTLSPATATNTVGTEHCVTATVADSLGQPLMGVTVRFSVMGAVPTSGASATDEAGAAEFCYDGPASPGTDAITAFADTDGNGTQGLHEPGATAGNTWELPPVTLVSLEVTPHMATVPPGGTQQFVGVAHFSDGSTQTTDDHGGGGGPGPSTSDSGGPSSRLWSMEFPTGLSLGACGISNSFISQAFSSDAATGAVDVTWSPITPVVRLVGTLVPDSSFDGTLTCADGSGPVGTVHATWSGPTATRFFGSYTFGAAEGDVVIKGWSSKASMPEPRFAVAAAGAAGKLYTFGGASIGALFSRTDEYDPATDTWTPRAPMPAGREGAGAAVLGSRIYVAGGNQGGSAHATVDAFDPATGTWDSSPADLHHPRAHFALVSTGAELFAIGGETGPGFTGVMASVERYDPVSNTWTEVAPLPEPRSFLAAGALNDGALIVAAGGGSVGGTPSSTPYIYDVADDSWRPGPPMLFTVGVAGGAVLGNGFYLWSSGGPCSEPGQIFIPEITTPFSTRPEGWAMLAPMPTPRGQFGMAAVGDVIYATGGQTGPAPVDTMESYTSIPWDFYATSTPSGMPPCGPGGGGGGGSEGPVWRVLDESIASIDQDGLATGLSPGTTTVVIEFGGLSCLDTDSCATLTVADVMPPVITNAAASTDVLWPPNHRMVPVALSVSAQDEVDPSPACTIASVASSEPIDGLGDGDTSPDWLVTGPLTVDLRAERGGRGGGRIYTITVRCEDASGNAAEATVTVSAPHDRR